MDTRSLALFHVGLSTLTFGVLLFAGLLALLLALQEYWLRKKQNSPIIRRLPSLESLEHKLFQVNTLGFILLTLLIATSIYFYSSFLFSNNALLQKTLLAASAWIIFAVLLIGRFVFGWRGRKAVYGTLLGVVLLFFAYFGSQLLLRTLH